MANKIKNSWGGPWTEKKLKAFEDYVVAYLKIMNTNPFWETIYFDGFAGSGERISTDFPEFRSLFEDDEANQTLYEGSAERISKFEDPNRFNYYYLIEKNKKSIEKLKLKIEPLNKNKSGIFEFRSGDCNGELIKLANALHQNKPNSSSKKYAALIFLDPFGMQIEWNGIEKLRDTRSDVWILLPTAVIVNRLLDRKGKLKSIKKLVSFFGISEEEIKNFFYVQTGQQNLFDDNSDDYKKIADPIENIAKLYVNRMKDVWKYVTEPPLRLNNKNGNPLFHFVFASNNAKAFKIANHIIKS